MPLTWTAWTGATSTLSCVRIGVSVTTLLIGLATTLAAALVALIVAAIAAAPAGMPTADMLRVYPDLVRLLGS